MEDRGSTLAETSRLYRRFAETEARGRSALYETFARGIAEDEAVLDHLGDLPQHKRQPNLLLAAARHAAGLPPDWPAFRDVLLGRWEDIREVILTRSTQTNEPGRCAALLPLLARLPQPLALIEVGASAGLCLLPDRYAYDYGRVRLQPATAADDPPVFPCRVDATMPLPAALPEVVWRCGLDLNPLDPACDDDMRWLKTLVWPEQTDRLSRLEKAITIARADPPLLVRGDLRDGIAALAASAPKGATLVIFHTAVLDYVSDLADREAFASQALASSPAWIANEFPRAFPRIAAQVPGEHPPGSFLLSFNGKPVAWTDPHGAAMRWLEDFSV